MSPETAAGDGITIAQAPGGRRLSADTIAALTVRSDARGLRQTAVHGIALAATATLVTLATPSSGPWWLALWLHGCLLSLLFAPLHECIHRTAFASRSLNSLVASACGLVLALPPRYFRAFHLAHHRHTGDETLDPELARAPAGSWPGLAVQLSGLGYWWERSGTLLRHARGVVDEPFVAVRERAAVCREARGWLLAYALLALASLAAGSTLLLEYWLLPLLLGQPLLRALLLCEHAGCERSDDMLRNSRTTLASPVLRALYWNMSYHAEHHALAAAPFHRLPAVHRALASRRAVAPVAGYRRALRAALRSRLAPS